MGEKNNGSGANLGFENRLWEAADKLRGHMDASEYKHVVLGLIFLKYISDRFEQKMPKLVARLQEQFDEAGILEKQIGQKLEQFGFGEG